MALKDKLKVADPSASQAENEKNKKELPGGRSYAII